MDPRDNGHDRVEANRAEHPRKTPGREPLGMDATRRVGVAMAAILTVATVVLVWLIATAR